METNFNFKSAICTSREQSERLLALGLKKETADCVLPKKDNLPPLVMPYDKASIYTTLEIIPAWSLGRLIEMMPRTIVMCFIGASGTPIERYIYAQDILTSDDSIAKAISTIEWLIKEGYFPKEYLV